MIQIDLSKVGEGVAEDLDSLKKFQGNRQG